MLSLLRFGVAGEDLTMRPVVAVAETNFEVSDLAAMETLTDFVPGVELARTFLADSIVFDKGDVFIEPLGFGDPIVFVESAAFV